MRSAWIWVGSTLLIGFGAVVGCGGSSESDDVSRAGAPSGGSGGNAAGAGSSDGGTGGDGSAGEPATECARSECGPQLGLANWTCADGSIGGPTGRCLSRPGGTCGWEINNCPMVGNGGASGQGGQDNAGGESAAAGAASSDACGGCAQGEVCVLQIGGTAGGHLACAMQTPCAAAGACACIVGQGTCNPDLTGDPPYDCACDNGIR